MAHACGMLKITISRVPGGIGPERHLGELLIGNVSGEMHADYQRDLKGADLPNPLHTTIKRYPRWSTTVWDLVGRAIAKSLSGSERLPQRPRTPRVPTHTTGTIRYVRMAEIPEPARSVFERQMRGSAVLVIEGGTDCVYAWAWEGFISGGRRR